MREKELKMNIDSAKLRVYFSFPNIDWIEFEL